MATHSAIPIAEAFPLASGSFLSTQRLRMSRQRHARMIVRLTQNPVFSRSRQVISAIDFVDRRPSALRAARSPRINASFFLWLHRSADARVRSRFLRKNAPRRRPCGRASGPRCTWRPFRRCEFVLARRGSPYGRHTTCRHTAKDVCERHSTTMPSSSQRIKMTRSVLRCANVRWLTQDIRLFRWPAMSEPLAR